MEVATNSMAHTVQRTRPRCEPADGSSDEPASDPLSTAVLSAMQVPTNDKPFLPTDKRDPAPLRKLRLPPVDDRQPASPGTRSLFSAPYRAAPEWRETPA